MNIGLKEFLLLVLAVAIGGLVALAIAGLYAKQQLSSATAGNTTLGKILNLFAPAAS